MPRPLFRLRCIYGKCVADGTHQTPRRHHIHLRICFSGGTQACIGVKYTQLVTACFTSASDTNPFLTRRLLRGSMGRIRSQANEFHIFKCPKKHVSSRYVADDEVNEAVTSWLQMLDTDFYYKGI
jgi:hypothetical protein